MLDHHRLRRYLALFAMLGTPWGAGQANAADSGHRLTFEKDVRPILKTHCFHCHGENATPKAGLDLRLVRTMVGGGISGEAIAPGASEESLLWFMVDDDMMPPIDTKLSAGEKQILAAWIDQGAKTLRPEPESVPTGMYLTEEDRAFWSFQPIERTEVPEVRDAGQVRNPIDAFLLARLEQEGLSFAPETDRRTLIRRATFDLHGLPPTPEEIAAFVGDDRPDAYERLIDRLLASPRYGERWARHWLDVAGYADSEGYTAEDPLRAYAYKYRDYLIRSLNTDRPWDELIREQLAGDEMVEPPYNDLEPAEIDKLVATGFLHLAPDGTASRQVDDAALASNDVVAESMKVVSTSLLGLTVGCAQCHTHRYDPISHQDYHAFRAIFEPAYDPQQWRTPTQRRISLWTETDHKRAAEVDAEVKTITAARQDELEALVQRVLEKELGAAPENLRDALRAARDIPKAKRSPEQNVLLKDYPRVLVTTGNVSLYDGKAHREITGKYDEKIREANSKRPPEDYVRAMTEVPGRVPETHLFRRGDHTQPAERIEPGELTVLGATAGTPEIPNDDPQLPTTGRRLAYVRHLTGGNHPLLPRVLVNRFWLHHFGRGIVATPGDFGRLGERPTHPELLDWLADEFMARGWSLKELHRLLMTSTAYRQSSRREGRTAEIDPENRLLGRMSVRRLETEAVRDAMLAVSGQLSDEMFGPPVPVTPDEVGQIIVGVDNRDSAGRPTGKQVSLGPDEFRRSLYIQVRRSLPLGVLETFDAPLMTPNCELRKPSTTAPQALMLMNNDFLIEQSEAFARRVAADAGAESAVRVRRAWALALGQEPTATQVEAAIAFLDAQRADFDAAESDDKKTSDDKKAKAPTLAADVRAGQRLPCATEFERIPVRRLNRETGRCPSIPARSHRAATSWPRRAWPSARSRWPGCCTRRTPRRRARPASRTSRRRSTTSSPSDPRSRRGPRR